MRISSRVGGVVCAGRRQYLCRVAVTVALAAASGAWAQEAAQQPDGNTSNQLQEVVVTGSHISASTFNSPTPVTTIDSNTIQNLGLVSVDDVINQIPQNSNFTSAANVGLGNFNIGAQFANLRGLDPFFGTRTLTMINTERVVPTSAGGAVDLNIVPSLLIDRVDVVTGGASAAYGSDAVAGVVNIILDDNFEGAKIQVDGGETSYHDGGDLHVAAKLGHSFFDGKVHELFGAEYEDAQGIGACGEVRPWCAQGYAEYTNAGYLTNGQPHYVIGPGATYFQPTTGMLDSLSPLGYLGQFNAAGTALEPFNPGTYGTGAPFTATQNGSGPNYYDGVSIRPPVIHSSVYSHTSARLFGSVTASLDISLAQRRAVNTQESSTLGAPTNLIYPDNAYLPAAVSAAMGGAPAFLNSEIGGQAPLINSTTSNTGRAVLSLKGDIAGSWKWNGYYEWGETGTRERLANDEVQWFGLPTLLGGAPAPAGTYDFLNWALGAVRNAAGQVVCAATLPGNPAYNPLAAGCSPLNAFGSGNASAAGLAYAFRTLHEDSAFTQQVVSGNADGTLFSGFGAGPVKAAVGFEYRHSMASVTHDQQDQPWYNQYFLSYGSDYSGNIDVLEGYGELQAPLLKDLPLARSVDLDLAIRETENKADDSLTGTSSNYNFPTWKITLNDAMTDWLTVRATRSRDSRAPSFYEMWAQTVDTGGLFGTVVNPWVNPPGSANYGTAVDAARVASGGYSSSLGLRPEEADTTTAGIVLSPTGVLDGMHFSADWFQILIGNAIAEVVGGAGSIINACYGGASFYCQFVQGTPNGSGGYSQITGVDNYNLNIGQYTTRGVDFEFAYHFPLDRLFSSSSDSLDLRALATYEYQQVINPGNGLSAYNYAGQTGPTAAFGDFNTVPKWQGNTTLTYTHNNFNAVLQVRIIGEGSYGVQDSNTGLPFIAAGQPGYATTYGASINNNSVASATYFNLALNYTLPFFNDNGHSIQVFGSLDNMFNRDPPVAPGGNGYPTNPVYFDTYGRTWRMGMRLQL